MFILHFMWIQILLLFFMAGSLFALTSGSHLDLKQKNAHLTYRNSLSLKSNGYALDMALIHLNFFHQDSFSDSYLVFRPTASSKNWKFDGQSWFSVHGANSDDRDHYTFSVMEAYYTQSLLGFNFYAGRRIYEWTKHEDLKPVGSWNGAWDFNRTNPLLEGLIGFFLEKDFNQKSRLNIFFSPVSVPRMSHASFTQKGGIAPKTPWFNSPPREIEWENLKFPVGYFLADIDRLDTLTTPQFGLSYDYDGKNIFFKTSTLFGPAKDLDLGLNFALVPSTPSTPVEVIVTPKDYNIWRFGLDFGLKWSETSLTGVSLNHRERRNDLNQDVEQSFVGLGSGSTLQLYHTQKLFRNQAALTLFLNENTSLKSQTNGELAEVLESYLSTTFRFIRGAGFKFDTSLFRLTRAFIMAYYDVKVEGVLGRLNIESRPTDKLVARLGIDMVEALNKNSQGFYRDFRRNDFIYFGVGYVL